MSNEQKALISKLLGGQQHTAINSYKDIINQRGLFDELGDAFTDQSKQLALNGKQRMGNAFKAGLGAGFKGSQDEIRKQKLEQLESYSKEVAEYQQRMAIQLGQKEHRQAAISNFTYSNIIDLKKINDSITNGDEKTTNDLAIDLFNRFSQEHPDLAEGFGQIDHVYGGKAYFSKGNETKGVLLKDLMEPLITTLEPEAQRELTNLMSMTTKNKFEKSDLFEDLSIQEKRANIALHNAHAQHYRDATEINKQKINNTEDDISKAVKIDNSKANRKTIETKIVPDIKSLEGELKIYGVMENILKENPNIVGSDLQSKVRRGVINAFGLEDSIGSDYLKLNSIEFEKRLKPLLGGQLGKEEGDRVLGKYINLDLNPKAIRKYLEVNGQTLRNEIAKNKKLLDQYNKDPSANLFAPEYYENEAVKEKYFIPNNVKDIKNNRSFKSE